MSPCALGPGAFFSKIGVFPARQKIALITCHLGAHKRIGRFLTVDAFWTWEATDVGNCPPKENPQKRLGEGATSVLDPMSK